MNIIILDDNTKFKVTICESILGINNRHFGSGNSLLLDYPVHCRTFLSTTDSTSLEASSTQPSQTISAVASIISVDIKVTPKRKALFQVGRGMQSKSLFTSLHCPSLTNMLKHETS